MANHKTPANKEELVLAHMREAFFYARQVCRARIEDGEIYSLCYKALVECAKNYQPDWQRFFAYSKANLRGNISRYWKTLDTVKNASLHETGEAPIFESWGEILEAGESIHDDGGPLDSAPPTALEPAHVDADFDSINIREQLALIRPLMESKLSEQERMVLDLSYTGGFNFEIIGKMLTPAVSRSAVQQTHARAIRKLRNELARQKKLD